MYIYFCAIFPLASESNWKEVLQRLVAERMDDEDEDKEVFTCKPYE